MPNIVMLDGSYVLHRSIHSPAYSRFTTASGFPTGGVYGFLATLRRLEREHQAVVLVAWEGGGSALKRAAFPAYKASRAVVHPPGAPRPVDPTRFAEQQDLVRVALDLLGVPSAHAPGYEADDVLATWARAVHDVPGAVGLIYSTDHDLWQCVSPRVRVLNYRPGGQGRSGGDEVVDEARVAADYGSVAGVVWEKVLRGDASDCVPPVQFARASGQGRGPLPPRAVRHLVAQRPRDVEDLLRLASPDGAARSSSPDSGRDALGKFLLDPAACEDVRRNHRLVKLRDDAPVEYSRAPRAVSFSGDWCPQAPDLPALFALLEFRKFAAELPQWEAIRDRALAAPLPGSSPWPR